MRAGVIGLGRMGRAMAERLVSLDHQVSVWSRSSPPVAGAAVAATPADLARRADVIVTSLYDGDAVRAVYFGAEGLCSTGLAGRLVLDTSTVTPLVSQEVAAAVRARGGRFADAPVLGTVGPCRRGELIAMVGAEDADVADIRAALQPLARLIHHMGPVGSGSAAKLAVNLLMGSYWAVLGESLALARSYDVDQGQLLDIIQAGPAALACLPAKRTVLDGPEPPADFTIAAYAKDLQTIAAAADPAFELNMLAGSLATFSAAAHGRHGERDVAAIALRTVERSRSVEDALP